LNQRPPACEGCAAGDARAQTGTFKWFRTGLQRPVSRPFRRATRQPLAKTAPGPTAAVLAFQAAQHPEVHVSRHVGGRRAATRGDVPQVARHLSAVREGDGDAEVALDVALSACATDLDQVRARFDSNGIGRPVFPALSGDADANCLVGRRRQEQVPVLVDVHELVQDPKTILGWGGGLRLVVRLHRLDQLQRCGRDAAVDGEAVFWRLVQERKARPRGGLPQWLGEHKLPGEVVERRP
jgi:hypothetical protein